MTDKPEFYTTHNPLNDDRYVFIGGKQVGWMRWQGASQHWQPFISMTKTLRPREDPRDAINEIVRWYFVGANDTEEADHVVDT